MNTCPTSQLPSTLPSKLNSNKHLANQLGKTQSNPAVLLRVAILILGSLGFTGCESFRFPGVFKIDVAQGNIVTKDMLQKLKPGMTKGQVRYVMGSPLISDTFHPNRWDYFYSLRQGDKDPVTKHVSLYFENEQFSHFEGDVVTPEEIEKYKAYQPKDQVLENRQRDAEKDFVQ